ncbi:unnamed protein product [Oppiella nova]|uniref:Uncharacterized protein n=1 Tax=Oppiella nova TaxID=334625 RepID=A0A7R9LAE9_9ACAR|nr:unnamed protein product [Oppiella nova]CAG2159532.1 unnamed protein product [Oppiella nova]
MKTSPMCLFNSPNKIRLDNPVATHKTPKIGRALPKDLSEQDVEALIQAPDVTTALGLRDRAMFEVKAIKNVLYL